MSPMEFYRTSGAGLWQDAEGLGLPLISVLATGSSSLTEGSSLQTVMDEGFCSKAYKRRMFFTFTQEVEGTFQISGLETLRLLRKSGMKRLTRAGYGSQSEAIEFFKHT